MGIYINYGYESKNPLSGWRHYLDIIAGVVQGGTLASDLFIVCLHYVLRTSIDLIKENGFMLAKERRRR